MIAEKIAQLRGRLVGGVSPAMATPLEDDGVTVRTSAVGPLLAFLAGRGVKGLFVGGTTGEGITLDFKQREILHESVMTAAAELQLDLPILLHVGANSTREALSLARHGAEVGPDALVVITPWFFGIDDDALFDFFAEIAAQAPAIPFLVYDIPQASINGISPGLLERLGREIPNFGGLKCSRTDAQMIRRLLDARPPGTIFLAGNEQIALGSLALGADGLISGLSTAVPEPFVALTAAFAAGDIPRAREIQRLINDLLDLLPNRRLGAIKRILAERGIPAGPVVPPRQMPPEAVWPRLAPFLDQVA